jgi:hypothetical protein
MTGRELINAWGFGGRPLWCAFRTQVGHRAKSGKCPISEVATPIRSDLAILNLDAGVSISALVQNTSTLSAASVAVASSAMLLRRAPVRSIERAPFAGISATTKRPIRDTSIA